MIAREQVERLLADLRRRRGEAEADAGHAAENLVRLVSGLTPAAEADAGQVRAAADEFADAAERIRALERTSRELRALLM